MDVAMLNVDSLADNRIRLHQEKTGEHVSVLIPKKVADDLRSLPRKSPRVFLLDWKVNGRECRWLVAATSCRRVQES